jgi:hypothetical protein
MALQISGIGDLSSLSSLGSSQSISNLMSASMGGFNPDDMQAAAPASRGDGTTLSDEAQEDSQQGPSPEQQKFELENRIHFLDEQIQQANMRLQTMNSETDDDGPDRRSQAVQKELNDLTKERGDLQMQVAQMGAGGGGAAGGSGGGSDIGGLLGGIGKAVGGLLDF